MCVGDGSESNMYMSIDTRDVSITGVTGAHVQSNKGARNIA